MAQEPAAFFSYARGDSDFALRVVGDLKAAGAKVWLDQLDIRAGQRWDRAVEDALTRCITMLVVLSPNSVASTNVMDEVSFALEQHKAVVPIIYRDCSVPFRLRRLQYADFRQDYARGLAEVLRTLASGRAVEDRGPATFDSLIPDEMVGPHPDVVQGAREQTEAEPDQPAEQEGPERERQLAAEQTQREERVGSFGLDSLTKVLLQNGEVFFNRQILRDFLSALISRNARSRVLVVNGPAGSGKSYTGVLTDSVSRSTGRLDCRRFDLFGRESAPAFVRGIFDTFRWRSNALPPSTGESIAQHSRELAEIIRRKAQESRAVVLLHVNIRETPATETLELLQTLIAEPGQLALILTGFSKAWVPPQAHLRVVFEDLGDLLRVDVQNGIASVFGELNKPVSHEDIDRLTEAILESASQGPNFNSRLNNSVNELVAKATG